MFEVWVRLAPIPVIDFGVWEKKDYSVISSVFHRAFQCLLRFIKFTFIITIISMINSSNTWLSYRFLNKGDDVVVCLPGAKIEAITERVENIVGSGKGGSVLVHVDKNNAERECATAIFRKYRNLVRTLKQTRVEQVILSGI